MRADGDAADHGHERPQSNRGGGENEGGSAVGEVFGVIAEEKEENDI